jgi:hypothetical protein
MMSARNPTGLTLHTVYPALSQDPWMKIDLLGGFLVRPVETFWLVGLLAGGG